MGISVYPVTLAFAAEVGDIDLSQPLDAANVEAVKQAFWTYSVLVFPDQHLTVSQHLAFVRYFGPHETTIAAYRGDEALRLPAEIADVSNIAPDEKIWGRESRVRMYQLGNRLWHTDSSFKRLPALASMLYARSIAPIGGHTEFADCRAAYDALSQAMQRRITGLVAEHSIFNSRARMGFTDFSDHERRVLPPVPQVLARTIPQNGRRSIYLASHIGRIFGLSDAEAKSLVDELLAHTTQRQFVYTHRWRLHDLVMWDNRCTMHRGTDFDDLRWRRDVQRATVSDIAPTCEQEGIQVAA